jgi:hypothetical protein
LNFVKECEPLTISDTLNIASSGEHSRIEAKFGKGSSSEIFYNKAKLPRFA